MVSTRVSFFLILFFNLKCMTITQKKGVWKSVDGHHRTIKLCFNNDLGDQKARTKTKQTLFLLVIVYMYKTNFSA